MVQLRPVMRTETFPVEIKIHSRFRSQNTFNQIDTKVRTHAKKWMRKSNSNRWNSEMKSEFTLKPAQGFNNHGIGHVVLRVFGLERERALELWLCMVSGKNSTDETRFASQSSFTTSAHLRDPWYIASYVCFWNNEMLVRWWGNVMRIFKKQTWDGLSEFCELIWENYD